MYILTLLVIVLALAGVAAFLRPGLWSFHLVVLLLLAAAGLAGALPGAAAVGIGAVYALLVLPVTVPVLRRRWISRPVLAWFGAVLPPLSDTEREAIEAGTVWWDRDLFSGDPDWKKLLACPPADLTEEEQAFLDGPAEQLCAMLDDWQITGELKDLPPPVWEFLKRHKFMAMIVPVEYGGLGFSAAANSAVVMKIASRSVTAAVTVMVPNSLGPAELLVQYGTDDQRDYYLPRLASGEAIPCFALTAPTAGSDAGAIPDRGVVCYGEYRGEQVLGMRVSWNKRYITLGPVATVLGLAFKAYDPDRLLGDTEELGITCALIPTDTPGVNIGNRHLPLDIPFMNGPNSGHDVFVPLDWVIGKERGVGDGWRMLMGCLAAGRAISLPALAVASGKVCSRFVGAYARVRKQFKLPIGKFEGVQEPLGRIAGLTYLMDAGRAVTAGAIDRGEKPTVLSAILKFHNTEAMRAVVNDAMDITGGKGICLGPKNFLGRTYQAVPISITVEGANILTRNMIIFGQGAFRCHPYVLEEIEAAGDDDPERGLRRFDRALKGHAGHVVRNLLRTFFLGVSGARLARAPVAGPTAAYYRHLARFSSAFAVLADASMSLLGAELKRKERLSARLGDCLSYLYYASAALKHYEDQGRREADAPLVHWSVQWCLHRIQQAMLDLLNNYPLPWAGRVLKVLVFPYGPRFKPPADRLEHALADLILEPGEVRDRLTDGIYINKDPDDATGCVEYALERVVEAAPAERRLYKATGFMYQSPADEPGLQRALRDGLIDEDEAEQLRRAAAAVLNVIAVDDFSPDQLKTGDCRPSGEFSEQVPASPAGDGQTGAGR